MRTVTSGLVTLEIRHLKGLPLILIIYCKFSTECNGERILKIGQDLAKLWQKNKVAPFFRTRCISYLVPFLSYRSCSNSDTLRFRATLCWLRDNVRCSSWAHCKARSGLPINVNWTFFARSYGWVATSQKISKIGDFAPTRSRWSKISGRIGRPPPIIFARLVRPMNALQLCCWQFLRAIIGSKSAILLQQGPIDPKCKVEGVAPHQPFFFSEN